jgi:hypothetical protein
MYRFRNKRMSTRCSASKRYVPIFVFETNECLPGVLHRELLALLVRVTVYGLGFSGLGFGKGHMSNVRSHVKCQASCHFFFVWKCQATCHFFLFGRTGHMSQTFFWWLKLLENGAFFKIFLFQIMNLWVRGLV